MDEKLTEREKELLRQALDCHLCLEFIKGITKEEIMGIMEKLK